MKKIAIILITIALIASLLSLCASAIHVPSSDQDRGDYYCLYIGERNPDTSYGNRIYCPIMSLYKKNLDSYTIEDFKPLSEAERSYYSLSNAFFGDLLSSNHNLSFATVMLSDSCRIQTVYPTTYIKSFIVQRYTDNGSWDDRMEASAGVTGLTADTDLMLIIDHYGVLSFLTYSKTTGEALSIRLLTNYELNALSGNIIRIEDIERIPSDYNQTIKDAYNAGKEDGIEIGKNEAVKNFDTNYQNAYYQGLKDGQDTDDIVSNSISGFFRGMTSFFAPFLSIGIGSLTVYGMLGLAIITSIVIVILKVVRK